MGGDWIARDAASVWHGFTQMSSYADNAPIVVERAEGHELIDVDGRRYLDAISSLWVNTLGHRVPELDDAVRAQLDRGAHSTMLGNGNRVVVELAEALASVVPVDDPHVLFASDGASAVEQALKIAFQFWVNRGVGARTPLPRVRRRVPRRHDRRALRGRRRIRHRRVRPAPLSRAARAGVLGPRSASRPRSRWWQHTRRELAAVIVEPLVQGAAGMQLADPDGLAALGAACRAHDVLLICDEVATGFGRTGTLFASEQCDLRPDLLVLGKGITGGYLPMSATVASGARVRRVPRRRPRRAHALPRALVLGERARGRGRAASSRAPRSVGRARERARPLRRAARIARRPHRATPVGRRRCASAGSWVAWSSRQVATTCAGGGACARRRSNAACCCARSATSWCSCHRSRSRRPSCTASCTSSPTRSTRCA